MEVAERKTRLTSFSHSLKRCDVDRRPLRQNAERETEAGRKRAGPQPHPGPSDYPKLFSLKDRRRAAACGELDSQRGVDVDPVGQKFASPPRGVCLERRPTCHLFAHIMGSTSIFVRVEPSIAELLFFACGSRHEKAQADCLL